MKNRKNYVYSPPFKNDSYIHSKTPPNKNHHQEKNYLNNGKVSSQDLHFDINNTPSLICKTINYTGDPVTINGEIVSNKLILSCHPKHNNITGLYIKKPTNLKNERVPNNVFHSPEAPVITNEIDHTEDLSNHPHTNGSNVKNNIFDSRNLGGGESLTSSEHQGEKYEEQYRTMQCKRYERNFKVFLWVLFIINILLILIGISLLLLTLLHLIFRNYIDIVITQTGFVTWVWITVVLSLLVIIVGVYGVAASITRTRTILITYCIIAAILALIILIFLVIFWILIPNLKAAEQRSMINTFNMYRCHALVHRGWDDLQSKFGCCGVDYRTDWKYIPPSCCNTENSLLQKLSCVGHFIKEDQAYKGGCRTDLEEYFSTMFMLITCLLILAFILLLLGILAALRLMKMYKVVLLCRDMYIITS